MRPAVFASIALSFLFPGDRALADTIGDCPVTLGSNRIFGPPFPASDTWFGTEALAIVLPPKGIWPTTGPTALIAVKAFWWSAGCRPGMETNLTVTIRNLRDGPNDAVASRPTNAHAESLGGWTMLTGIDFKSPGCWQITGDYLGQSLTFVVKTVNSADYPRDDY